MNKTIALLNMKGGVGKTTSSLNIAAGFANKGHRVLLIDLDPQANSTDILLDIKEDEIFVDIEVMKSINEMNMESLDAALVRLNEHEYKEIFIDQMLVNPDCTTTYQSNIDNLHVIPSRLELANVEKMIRNGNVAAHNYLKKVIKKVEDEYDYIFIDCPPIINILTMNVLNVVDEVIAPIKVDRGAEKGLIMTIRELLAIAISFDLEITIRPLFTMVQRNNTDKARIETMLQFSNDVVKPIFTSVRHQAKPVAQASYDNTLVINKINTNVGKDYQLVVDYLEEQWI